MSRGFGAAFAAENHLSHHFQTPSDDAGGEGGSLAVAPLRLPPDKRGAVSSGRGRDDESPGLEVHEDDLLAEFKPVKDSVNKVNWSSMALSTLPNFKPNQLEAQVLWINDNKIASLPSSIRQLSKLQTLRIDDNQIQIIPGFISACSQIEILTAKRNKIHQLSMDFFDLQVAPPPPPPPPTPPLPAPPRA
jgi:hypothetical protein